MKATMDNEASTGHDGGKRGLFRRAWRGSDDGPAGTHDESSPTETPAAQSASADQVPAFPEHPALDHGSVQAVDDLARRVDALADGAWNGDADVRAAFDLQRAAIARSAEAPLSPAVPLATPALDDHPATPARTTAAAATPAALASNEPAPIATEPAPAIAPAPPVEVPTAATAPSATDTVRTQRAATHAPENDMQSNEPHAPSTSDEHDILARMDAVLAARPQQQQAAAAAAAQQSQSGPAGSPIVAPATAPSAATSQGAPSVLLDPPVSAPATVAAPTAARLLGIDAHRVIQLLEEEAQTAQNRIDVELRNAQAEAQSVIGRAEVEAERIREHGQAQARVLLGEVEEIISEAQQTGEQILHRANDEAGTLRGEATAVLQQAHQEARSIVEAARRDGEQVLAEQRRLATVRAQEAMREQDRLKDQIRRLEERRRQVLESLEPLIAQLTQMMPTDAISANVVQLDRGRPTVQHQG